MSQLKEVNQQLRDLRSQKKKMLEQKKQNSEERTRLVALLASTRVRITQQKKELAVLTRQVPSLFNETHNIDDFRRYVMHVVSDLESELALFKSTVQQLNELV